MALGTPRLPRFGSCARPSLRCQCLIRFTASANLRALLANGRRGHERARSDPEARSPGGLDSRGDGLHPVARPACRRARGDARDRPRESREAAVGAFSLDLLARDAGTGRTVIIENQLEPTNHDHLGKLLTYAGGHDANVIVWVAKEFREEHRQALDWLNQRTSEETAFFGVRVEVWRIDDSRPAPHFTLIAAPNEWRREAARTLRATVASERNLRFQAFFQVLIDALRERGFTRARRPLCQHARDTGAPWN